MSFFDSSRLPVTQVVSAGDQVPLFVQDQGVYMSSALGTIADYVVGTIPVNTESLKFVNSIDELRAVAKTEVQFVTTKGYYSTISGGGGTYWHDASDVTSADNGFTVIVASDGGRWKIITDGVFDVTQAGAKGDGISNDFYSFSVVIAALPAAGGHIKVPGRNYLIDGNLIALYQGIKSIYWDIDPTATFTGTGTGYYNFPNMDSNGGQLAVGPYIYSCSSTPSPYNPLGYYGGIAALNVEMIQPSSYVGQSVAIYAGAEGNGTDPASNVWAINSVITAKAGAGGTYQNIEVDTNCYSSSAVVRGIVITGVGDASPDSGLYIARSGAGTPPDWNFGIVVRNSSVGLLMDGDQLTRGIVIGPTPSVFGSLISGRQLQDGQDCVVLQAKTITPTGYFIRCVKSDNSANLFKLDTDGHLTAANIIGDNLDTAGHCNAGTVLAGVIRASANAAALSTHLTLGNGSASTVGATGAASALPANPLGYLVAYLGATKIQIPYYTAV